MAYSMTGYGAAQSECDGITIDVQIKTLNHRGLDIHVTMPRVPGQMELLFQRLIKQFVSRGRVDVTVTFGEKLSTRAGFNVPLLEARAEAIRNVLGKEWSYARCIEFCLGQEDVWKQDEAPLMTEHFYECVLETARNALEKLTKSRRAEGGQLEDYLLNALDSIDTCRQTALTRAPERISDYRRLLEQRMLELTQNTSFELEPMRIATEVALLADKIDVTEELTRIASHLSALRILIRQPADPLTAIGKKIDFYLQELCREATTMASKSHDAVITKQTIDIRVIIESLREQTANIQ